ncbi:hypothetical protein [Aliihoeflea sp. 40Bstr573]|uniref:hypothetical protein n=1 Tax=Aliihoeflea sp. 40Bstr573 TaxID=2696467 RepID=UPI0020958529|nr:hypothetical protein [Aliihoeflea sp. 40Bstr573]MCO6387491.1 hypothetical protein [Aliihoeflea sp. 40Bstr573]
MRAIMGLVFVAILTGCATPSKEMSTAVGVKGDYKQLASCLQEKTKDTAPWNVSEIDERRVDVRLGNAPGDVSRIEFHRIDDADTDVRFFIPHPESYIAVVLTCGGS